MKRRLTHLTAVLIGVLIITAPFVYGRNRKEKVRNFRTVRDGVLYRSGQLSPSGMTRMTHDYGLKTIVTLRYARDEDGTPPDAWEEDFCRKLGITHVRIRLDDRHAPNGGREIFDKGVNGFLKVMEDRANHPVLVHCFRGVHRTGTMVAAYRIAMEGWSNDDAIGEMKSRGYDNIDDHVDLSDFLENFQPPPGIKPLTGIRSVR